MKLTRSLFSNKIVEEEMEQIQKALVLAHSRFLSQGKFNEALKISNLFIRNIDEHGNFNIEAKNQILKKVPFDQNEYTEAELELSNQYPEDQFNKDLKQFFNKIGTYYLELLE